MEVLGRHGARNPRLFGSVARGDAGPHSDIDIVVDLDANHPGNPLLRLAGISEELSEEFGTHVDVICDELMRVPVTISSFDERVPM